MKNCAVCRVQRAAILHHVLDCIMQLYVVPCTKRTVLFIISLQIVFRWLTRIWNSLYRVEYVESTDVKLCSLYWAFLPIGFSIFFSAFSWILQRGHVHLQYDTNKNLFTILQLREWTEAMNWTRTAKIIIVPLHSYIASSTVAATKRNLS